MPELALTNPSGGVLVRIIFISRTKFWQDSSIIALIDGLLTDSIDCSEILRILRMKMQPKKRIVFK